MKNGLIIYNEKDKEINQWFIDNCLKSLNNDDFSLLYKEEKEALDYISKNHIDYVIFRARNYPLLNEIEAKGVRCFNNSLTNRIANNKYETYEFLKEHGFACLETFLDSSKLSFPFVMKSVDGHGGSEVFLVSSKENLKPGNKQYIYQRYILNNGDVRLYVLGKKIIGAVKRSNDKDFRSNFSLGGNVEAYKPTQEMIDTALKIASLLKSDYIGVDFIIDDKEFVVNEIEDPVGARMLFKTTGINAVSLFVEYIKNNLKDN